MQAFKKVWVFRLVVILMELSLVTATIPTKINSEGREFCIAMMIEPLKGSFYTKFISRYIMVGTASPFPVNFTLVYSKPGVEELVYSSHQTVLNDPYTESSIGMLDNITVDNDEFENRNKGICITSESDVYVVSYLKDRVNYKRSSSFLALPYQEILTDQYEYYIMSASCEYDKYFSGFILVGLRNDTSITIYPSIPLSIIVDTQSMSSAHVDVQPGQHHTVILHRRQTLFIGKDGGADVTGTRVVSNKPLTVLSGHEAGSVPNDGSYEPMLQQIPPTQLWGEKFMIFPYYDFPPGQVIKVLSSVDNIEITYYCDEFSNQALLQKAGNVHQFFMPSNASCYIEANNSVLVGQFPYSLRSSFDGDTTMILVASVDQYSNKLEFTALTSNHYVSIIVTVQHYSTSSILYDGNPINHTEWTPIYDSYNHMIGYGYGSTIGKGHHTLVNVDNDGRVFAMVYGFYVGNTYGFPAGFEFASNKALGVYFSSKEYVVHEGEGSVNILLQRQTHINYTDYYHFSTTDDSSNGNLIRYIPVSRDVVFYPMQSSLCIPIIIKEDSTAEPNEHFSISVQLCHTTDPLRDICIQAKVTVTQDDSSPSKTTMSSAYYACTTTTSASFIIESSTVTVTPVISNNNGDYSLIYIAVFADIGFVLLIACAVGIIIISVICIIRIRRKRSSQFQYRFLSTNSATNSSFTGDENDLLETNGGPELTDSDHEPLQDDDPEETAQL